MSAAPKPHTPAMSAKNVNADIVTMITARFDGLEKKIAEQAAYQDKRRHDLTGEITTVKDKLYLTDGRVSLLEQRVNQIDGAGTSSGGAMKKLELGQEKLSTQQATMAEDISQIRSDIRSMKDSSPSNPAVVELQAWKNKWLGVASAVIIVGGVVGLVIAGLTMFAFFFGRPGSPLLH